MHSPLQREFDYYLAHQRELVEKYNGRFIVIKEQAVIGDFATELEAIHTTMQKHPAGSFFVQFVSPGEESYTQTFHSRVSFA